MTTVPFDLDPQGSLCHGQLRWEDDHIIGVIESREIFRHPLFDVAELRQFGDVGCGRLELQLRNSGMEHNISVCRFSMSCVNEIGEFCKVVNYYLQTDLRTEIHQAALQRCEKCGRNFRRGMSTCLFCVDKRGVWKRAVKDFGSLRPALVKSVIFMMIFNLLTAAVPLLNGWLVELLRDPGGSDLPFGWTPGHTVWMAGIALALLYIFGRFFLSLSNIFANKAGIFFADKLRRQTYDKVQNLSLTSMARRTPGDMIKRVTNDTETTNHFIIHFGRAVLEKSILIVIISVVLFFLNPVLAALVVTTVPVTLILMQRFWRRMGIYWERIWRSAARERSLLHDIIKGIRVVKTFGTEQREIAKFANTSRRLKDATVAVEVFWALVNPFTRLAMHTGEILVIAVGGRMVINGTMNLGTFVMFTLLLAFLYEPLRWMAFLPRRLAEATNSLIKIYEILDEESTMPVAANPVDAPIEGPLRFEGLKFGYLPYEPVLKNIDLEVKPNEMLGLVGPSGAGKTTLINLAMRLYDPDLGRITANGHDLRDFDPVHLHQSIGVVFQETFLFAGSIYENIAYGAVGAAPQDIIRAAKIANAHEFIMKLPDGYNTPVGEDGHTLSGGERQRVAIARAVLRDPKILILDEATSALDPETEGKLQEALERLVKGRVTIAIAHRLSTLRHANRLAVIDQGSIAELGSHRELLAQKGIYYNLVMTQRQMSKETDSKKDEEEEH